MRRHLPTYLAVLIAAVEGLLETDFDLTGVQCSTGRHSPLLLINGPVRGQINVNYSSGALGHGWQANATIGRAIRLVLNNIGGARIGVTDMTTLGMAERTARVRPCTTPGNSLEICVAKLFSPERTASTMRNQGSPYADQIGPTLQCALRLHATAPHFWGPVAPRIEVCSALMWYARQHRAARQP